MLLQFNNIDELGKWCEQNLLGNKVIIVENIKEGSQILDTLVKSGYSSINLYCKTIEQMVKESINHILVKNSLIIISKSQCLYEMEKVLMKLKEQKN